jgi:hypothetical protein
MHSTLIRSLANTERDLPIPFFISKEACFDQFNLWRKRVLKQHFQEVTAERPMLKEGLSAVLLGSQYRRGFVMKAAGY